MARHWIGMAGLHGYLPQFCSSFDEYAEAVDALVQVHDLSRRLERELRRDGYVELSIRRHGNEYAEIEECDCDNPEQHND